MRRLPASVAEDGEADPERRFDVLEAVIQQASGYAYTALLRQPRAKAARTSVLAEGTFEQPPFVTFRWIKGAGELYGRSPVMTALPDIKTANKVVELILKNASIAVTGIWLADDDGVLNPANVKLVPGSIIPKAVGSAGLTPLQAPGRFDVSQLVLDDLRARIRHTLLTDRLGAVADRRMTATEVLERSGEMTRLLGAMFGRLQAELLSPLVHRAVAILRRRGELPGFVVDGRAVELQSRAPLARLQARQDVQNVLLWLDTITRLGPEASGVLNLGEAARWLATMLGVPDELVSRQLAARLAGGRAFRSGRRSCRKLTCRRAGTGSSPTAARLDPPAELCRCAAACFGSPSGRLVLRHLQRLFADRRLPPSATRRRAAPCRRPALGGQPPPPAAGARPRRCDRSRRDHALHRRTRDERPACRGSCRAPRPIAARPARPAPENVPEKFWDNDAGGLRADALLKSYMRAGAQARHGSPRDRAQWSSGRHPRRASRGRTCGRVAEPTPPAPPSYEIAPPHPLIEPDAELNARLLGAGFSQGQAQLVYDLAAERLLPVIQEALGEIEAQHQLERLQRHFGGAETWRHTARQLKSWAASHLDPAIHDTLAASYEGVLALHQMMRASEPELLGGGGCARSRTQPRRHWPR